LLSTSEFILWFQYPSRDDDSDQSYGNVRQSIQISLKTLCNRVEDSFFGSRQSSLLPLSSGSLP